jgi:hypothetical protein
VAVTRAKDERYLSHPRLRMGKGGDAWQTPSRFLNELNRDLVRRLAGEGVGGLGRLELSGCGDFHFSDPRLQGKSRLAMEVARRTGAEICSVDAFQIYRGLDIGDGEDLRRMARGKEIRPPSCWI